jgi:cell division protein FtsW
MLGRQLIEKRLGLDFGPRPDVVLLAVTTALLVIGLLMVTSASVTFADRQYDNPFHFLERQLFAAVLGLGLGWCMVKTPTRVWQVLGSWLAGLALFLLVLVLVPGLGHTANGSTRWLAVGGVNIVQVSEPARLMLLMYVADYAVRRNAELRTSFKAFVMPMLVVGFGAGLHLLQPDFGSAVLLVAISGTVLLVAGARLRELTLFFILGVTAMVLLAWISPYRMERITGFMDPWGDPFGKGFQLTQSLIAIGTGEWTGLGLGASVQKLFYLPEAHTDFIFAVIAEEFGLAGSLVMLGLYAVLVWRALDIATAAAAGDRNFQAYMAFGITVWLGFQALINMGVNMGALPTKGLTLPLVSYGRSSLIITLGALGLLCRIDLENRGLASSGGRRRGNARVGAR